MRGIATFFVFIFATLAFSQNRFEFRNAGYTPILTPTGGEPAYELMDEVSTDSSTANTFVSTRQSLSTTVYASEAVAVTKIAVLLYKIGSPTGNMTAYLYYQVDPSNTDQSPDDRNVSSTVLDVSTITATGSPWEWVEFTFSGATAPAVNDHFHIVLHYADGDGTNSVGWRRDTYVSANTGTWTRGSGVPAAVDDDVNWTTEDNNGSYLFKTYKGGPAGAGSFPTESLISFWPMDEASGGGVDLWGISPLTDGNTVTSTTSSGPDSDATVRAFAVANSEFLYAADHNNLDVGTGDFSVAMWYNMPSGIANNQSVWLMSKRSNGGSSADGWIVAVVADTGGESEVSASSEFNDGTTELAFTFSNITGSAINQWSYMMMIVDRTGDTADLYFDNVLHQSLDISSLTGSFNNTSLLNFGRMGSNYGEMEATHAALWKKALTTQERTLAYNSGSLFKPDTPTDYLGNLYARGVPAGYLDATAAFPDNAEVVDDWTDISGSGNDFDILGTGSTYSSTEDALSLTTDNETIHLLTPPISSVTAYAVAKTSDTKFIFAQGDSNVEYAGVADAASSSTTLDSNAGSPAYYVNGTTAGLKRDELEASWSTGEYVIFEMQDASVSAWDDHFGFFGYNAVGYEFNGYVKEVRLYDIILPLNRRSLIRSALAAEYGITLRQAPYSEDAEGTGTPSGWTTVLGGTWDWDDSTDNIFGTESVSTSAGSYSGHYTGFEELEDVWGYAVVDLSAWTSSTTYSVISLKGRTAHYATARYKASTNEIFLYSNGSDSAASLFKPDGVSPIHFWIRHNDGNAELYASESTTRPSTDDASGAVLTETGTAGTAERFQISNGNEAVKIVFDNINISETAHVP